MALFVNDRTLVEMILPAQLMLSVVLNGANDLEEPETSDTVDLLRYAEVYPVANLPVLRQRALLRRAERAYIDASAAYSGEGSSVGKFGLVVYYWLRGMIDAGYYEFPDGDAFQVAMDSILPALQPHADIEEVDRSARKQAPKMHRTLQRLGYYQGIDFPEEA